VKIARLKAYVRTLGGLAILNDGLSSVARRIQLGESIELSTPIN